MAWTNIPDANLDAGSPLRDVDLMALRDNIVYARNTRGFAIFTSSGIFMPVAGITTYRISMCGGGGNGGSGMGDTRGGNGGHGGAAIFYVNNVAVQKSIVVGGGGGGSTTAFGVTAFGGGNGSNATPQANGNNGAHGAANSGGLNATAHTLAMPYINSYGYGGGGGDGVAGFGGNAGICVIEW